MPSASFLIYSGCMPLLKIYIATFFGFLLAKKGLFPPAASRGASQVSMNLSLPCLIFANVVPAFTPTNVSAIGPLMLLAFTYQGIGFGIALILRELMYIPRNFWQGFVILVGMSNWGNLPSAVVMSVTTQAPFDPSTDPGLGLSFVSIFIVSYHITFWAFGAAASLAWDYAPHVPQREAAEKHVRWCQKPIGGWIARNILKMQVENPWTSEEAQISEVVSDAKDVETGPAIQMTSMDEDPTAVNTVVAEISRQVSRTAVPVDSKASPAPQPKSSSHGHHSRLHLALVQQILRPLKAAANSITITLVASLIISLVQPLKALFVDISHQGGPTWHGPDGRPPLAFVIDTASFIGGICIPLSLILLGASFARLRIPRPFGRLPIRAMFAAALSKMVVLPVIGVLIVSRMTQTGMMSRKALAERFVAMFLSGTPAAVNQMIVASLYSVDGDVDTLSAFLLVQYVLMFFTSAALTAVALALL